MRKILNLVYSIDYTLLLCLFFVVYFLLEESTFKTSVCVIIFVLQLINFSGNLSTKIEGKKK